MVFCLSTREMRAQTGPWKLNNEEIGPERFFWERRPVGRLEVLEQKEKERIEYVSMRFVEELESSK